MSERPSLLARLLRPIVQLREGEATTALLMFLYSFLAMTSYNIIKPITRSEYISKLGADDLPWVDIGDGSKMKVLQVKATEGLWIVQNILQAGYTVPTHKHTGPVWGYTISGAWRYKEYEQRVLLGVGRREGQSKLTDKQKATLLGQIAEESDRDFPPIMQPDWDDIKDEDPARVAAWIDAVDDILFGPREKVMSGATRIRNERAKTRTQGVTR